MIADSFGLAGSNSTPHMGVYPAMCAPTSAKPPPLKREAMVRFGFRMVESFEYKKPHQTKMLPVRQVRNTYLPIKKDILIFTLRQSTAINFFKSVP